jgi:hypothetical protein
MPILDTEIIWRPAALTSDVTPAQNGGRMRFAQLVSGVKNNLFPDVSQAERLAGAVKWRKAFIHVNSAQDTALLSVRLFLDALTPAGDFVTFAAGTHTDTENQITARVYGIGTLHLAVDNGATQLQVACENNGEYASLQPFRVGDLVRVYGSGNEEWATLTSVSYASDFAILDLAAPLANNYAIENTLVSSVLQQSSVCGAGSNFVLNSAAGGFDTDHLIAHNKGGIEQHWTLTFNNPTSFSVSGITVGSLPESGSTAADFMPLNPATGTPYFTLKASGWSGSFQAGETTTFDTAPAAIPLWYRRQVPAGTLSLANDYTSLAICGESA